jgi:hypothetical protein
MASDSGFYASNALLLLSNRPWVSQPHPDRIKAAARINFVNIRMIVDSADHKGVFFMPRPAIVEILHINWPIYGRFRFPPQKNLVAVFTIPNGEGFFSRLPDGSGMVSYLEKQKTKSLKLQDSDSLQSFCVSVV